MAGRPHFAVEYDGDFENAGESGEYRHAVEPGDDRHPDCTSRYCADDDHPARNEQSGNRVACMGMATVKAAVFLVVMVVAGTRVFPMLMRVVAQLGIRVNCFYSPSWPLA